MIVAGGDILFDRGVRAALATQDDPAFLFSGIAADVRAADLALANLECTLVDSGAAPVAKQFVFRGDPRMATTLSGVGFDALNLANNHTTDFGRGSLLETTQHLTDAGIVPIGAGRTRALAFMPRYMNASGRRVALLGFVDMRVEGLAPLDDEPTPASGDTTALFQSVKQAKQEADLVIVMLHWGYEYDVVPSWRQRELAARLAAVGADLILGSHPHVLQPIERIGRAIVCYSLGNLIFDQSRRECRETALVRVTFEAARSRIEVRPLSIEAARPVPASEDETQAILERINPGGEGRLTRDAWIELHVE